MSEIDVKQPDVDAGKAQLAAVYARALVGAAQAQDAVDSVNEELQSVVHDVFAQRRELQQIFESPRTTIEEKSQLIDTIFRGRASDTLVNFLVVLCRHNRLDCLREVAAAVTRQVHELQGRVRVQVRTAEPIDDTLRNDVLTALGKALGKEIVLETAVDPDLLGGMVVRVGDQVVDGSVRHRLERMREEAVRRMQQECQKQNQRFATT